MDAYQVITSQEQLDKIIKDSKKSPVILMKHSTRCPISAKAFKAFEDFSSSSECRETEACVVRVIENRDLSDYITKTLDVQHQSPQLVILKDGKIAWVSSHRGITKESLSKALSEIK